MKKILLALSSLALLVGCKTGGDDKKPSLTHIELSGDYQTEFVLNEAFNYTGLVVTACYSNNKTYQVTNYQVSSPDMSIEGLQDVVVTYKNKSESYSINIYAPQEDVYYPVSDAISFLTSRGVTATASIIPSSISSLAGVLSSEVVEDEDYPHFQVVLSNPSVYQTIYDQLSTLNYNMEGDIFVDQTETIGLEIYENNGELIINLYAFCDLIEIPPEEDPEEETTSKDFPLPDSDWLGTQSEAEMTANPFVYFGFSFAFAKGSSTSNKPKSLSSNCVYLYTGNTLTISTTYTMKEISFTLYEGSQGTRDGLLSSDVGSVEVVNKITKWSGSAKTVIFTAQAQYRFTNINIKYVDSSSPVVGGEKTISEVYQLADQIEYIPSATGWYLSDTEVTIKIKAIDAIDSVTTADLYPNARGKVLCVDETGYIIVSSGVSKNNPIDFYQRVKDYIKEGTTTYVVTGYIAFLNGVVEINVNGYQYDSSLDIEYDLNDYLTKDTVNSSDSFMNHCKTIRTNKNGYGVGEIVRLNGLTYFNKYRKAGSYYFLDRQGKLVPIYSLLDKDRSSLILGNTYDIIGLESIYNGRPSLRILEVIHSEEGPVDYDLANAVEKSDTAYFYNVNPDKPAYYDEFYASVTTVYKMEVYVSRYTDDKYTFNVNYHYDGANKEYTTGNSQVDAANHNSLGMSNESLDYNQTFYDYALELVESVDEIEDYIVTIYFTLALLKTVNGKAMWEANVFEDYVPQLGE